MASVTTYLNFPGTTEEAFHFYRAAFGTEFVGPVMHMGDAPPAPGQPALSDAQKKLVMHVTLPILGGHQIMGTDAVPSMGHPALVMGDNISLNLQPDTKAEAEHLFAALSDGGTVKMPLTFMFWGAWFGQLTDRFGVNWMFNCTAPKE